MSILKKRQQSRSESFCRQKRMRTKKLQHDTAEKSAPFLLLFIISSFYHLGDKKVGEKKLTKFFSALTKISPQVFLVKYVLKSHLSRYHRIALFYISTPFLRQFFSYDIETIYVIDKISKTFFKPVTC